MYSRLFLRVWILDKADLGVRTDAFDLVNRNEVIDALALVLQMKARVLQCYWKLDNRLADFVDLLVGRDLERGGSASYSEEQCLEGMLLTTMFNFPGS